MGHLAVTFTAYYIYTSDHDEHIQNIYTWADIREQKLSEQFHCLEKYSLNIQECKNTCALYTNKKIKMACKEIIHISTSFTRNSWF